MSTDEILLQVDSNANPIGEVARKVAHGHPEFIHVHTGCLIYNANDELLFQQRTITKERHPSLWTPGAGGHVSAGMTPEQCIHQELLEELGFDTTLIFIEKYFSQNQDEARFVYIYLGKYHDEAIVIDPLEVEQVKFFNYQHFLKMKSQITPAGVEYAEKFWQGELDQWKRDCK
ncbi:MAG: NUDIX domain-containing protein [bacterium]